MNFAVALIVVVLSVVIVMDVVVVNPSIVLLSLTANIGVVVGLVKLFMRSTDVVAEMVVVVVVVFVVFVVLFVNSVVDSNSVETESLMLVVNFFVVE